jgi:hypothetical protein
VAAVYGGEGIEGTQHRLGGKFSLISETFSLGTPLAALAICEYLDCSLFRMLLSNSTWQGKRRTKRILNERSDRP